MNRLAGVLAGWAAVVVTVCVGPAPTRAAGRVPYGGHLRVIVPAADVPRWHQSVGDCYLFRARPGGLAEPELARDPGGFGDGRLRLRIVDGARFHDGTPITADDVVASLRAAGTGTTPLARALGLLTVRAEAEQGVLVTAPRGVSAAILRGMLAHPIAAIRRTGGRDKPGADHHSGHGCGPFAPGQAKGRSTTFEAHLGHPRGRPWLDRVEIIGAESSDQAVEALVFGDAEATTVPSPRHRRVASVSDRGWGTVFAIPGDNWRGRSHAAARRRVASLMRQARFGAHFDTAVETAAGLLPPALSPRVPVAPRVDVALALDGLTIAYPAGRSDLADLARAVRDTLRHDVQGVARVTAVMGLDLPRATGAAPDWDLALVAFDWTAVDATQAALEASGRLPVPPVQTEHALRGAIGDWLAARREHVEVIPVIHVARPVFHQVSWHLASGSGSWGGLASSWRNP